jgi:hypothetical protein
MFDRDDTLGRRVGQFCSVKCGGNFKSRAYEARQRMAKVGKFVFRRGTSGRRAAILGSKKNKEKRALRNTKAVISSGEVEEILYSDGGQVQHWSSEMGNLSTSTSGGNWGVGKG